MLFHVWKMLQLYFQAYLLRKVHRTRTGASQGSQAIQIKMREKKISLFHIFLFRANNFWWPFYSHSLEISRFRPC